MEGSSASSGSPPPEGATDVHQPFTRAERMQQLSEIDQDVTALLELTGKAIQSLGKQESPSAPNGDAAAPDPQTEAFKGSMDAFLSTLHRVDVRLKRQIMALEEAGIVSLGAAKDAKQPGAGAIEPNGVGNIGNLDVGWLNSRSNKVERDMEAQLWTGAREHLEGVVEKGGKGRDVEMKE